MMKGQIPILEMIAVTVILFVSFGILFSQREFENRWGDADIILKGRDMVLTMDRIGMLGTFTSSPDALANFLSDTIPERNLIYWSGLEGTLQPTVTVACNCTTSQINDLINWAGRLKLNGRDIRLEFVSSSLEPIQQSDVLLIWGRTGLASYKAEILSYLASGKGVVGISDVTSPDSTYTEIFGVRDCGSVIGQGNCGGNGDTEITFVSPTQASSPTFKAHKLFFHMPIRSLGSLAVPIIPLENANMPLCLSSTVFDGTFDFKNVEAMYWICNATTVYMDTNDNNLADQVLRENGTFRVGGYDFKMSYIETNRTFVSIRPGFRFDDFRNSQVKVLPSDGDTTKILLRDGNYNGGSPLPVVVMNGSESGRVIWGSDFISSNVDHDKRLLIASMLLAASSKRSNAPTIGDIQTGFLTPYINVVNRDMLEIYQFNLGLGFPF